MSNFGLDTPFMLLAKLKVNEDKVVEAINGKELLIRFKKNWDIAEFEV